MFTFFKPSPIISKITRSFTKYPNKIELPINTTPLISKDIINKYELTAKEKENFKLSGCSQEQISEINNRAIEIGLMNETDDGYGQRKVPRHDIIQLAGEGILPAAHKKYKP